ncbi:MAG: pilus assembly protein PilM, partial [Candidatus Omnitrophica bacterium]|nr:pilus assembly protein PilM [Candidatus Omnitrophota bacterium]
SVQVGSSVMMNLLLVAAKRDELYPVIQSFRDAGLVIDCVDIDALATINALEFFYPQEFRSSTAVLDIGTEVSTLSVILEGKPRFIRDISYGGVDILKRLKRKLGLTEQQARQYVSDSDMVLPPDVVKTFQEVLGNLIADLKVSLDYYLDQISHAVAVKTLFLCGGEAYHPVVINALTRDLGLSVQPIDIFQKIQLDPGVDGDLVKKNRGFLSVPLGLCLR